VVLGGDKSVGPPRCVAHAWQLREEIRKQQPDLPLGGWANPHADAGAQAAFLAASNFNAEFYLTQVVSHHDVEQVKQFLDAVDRRGITLPGLFGVFYYRSANPRTLNALKGFLPVPVDGLTRDFAAGKTPEAICAETIRTLRDAGVRHFYISNLPLGRAPQVLAAIHTQADI
jgi:5,10-methylenetetrahydrofolate reductase